MKTCSKCGFIGEDELFVKNKSVCKKCRNEYMKEYYRKNPEKIKDRCKKYKEKNPEKVKEISRKYYEENREKIDNKNKEWAINHPERRKEICRKWYNGNKEHHKKYYKDNAEVIKKRSKKYREANPEKVKYRQKKYREANQEKIKEKDRKYRKTPEGRASADRHHAKRRELGHKPINNWFKGAEAHHLRYSKTQEEQDNNLTIYAPKKLHRSVRHNGNTGQGMRAINMLLLEWYLNETPEEERNPKAVKLYWNYCTLPEPEWSRDK